MKSKLKVAQIRSGIGRPKSHKQTLRGLGLTKLNKTVILEDTPSIRGMINKVRHLVQFEEIEE
ncbi:50S ribosomal protein L30 [Thermodesulfobacteriota bacterium]